jgi:hypothetical protein
MKSGGKNFNSMKEDDTVVGTGASDRFAAATQKPLNV